MSDYLIPVPVLGSLFLHLVVLSSFNVIVCALSYYNLFFHKKEHVEGKPNMNCKRTVSSVVSDLQGKGGGLLWVRQ